MIPTRMVVEMAMLVAATGLTDFSFGQTPVSAQPELRGGNHRLYSRASYGRGRRIRIGNKQQSFKSATQTANKAVLVRGVVGSAPRSNVINVDNAKCEQFEKCEGFS